jgi:hypothetical protein
MCRSKAVIPLILAIACTNAQNVTSAQRDRATIRCELTDDDYAVYAAILEWFKDPAKALPTKQLLIVDETVSMEGRNFEADWGAKSKSPGLETIADFTAKKGDVCSMKPELETLHGYAVVSSEEIDGYFKQGIVNGWRAFYAKYPKAAGLWRFSRPGYNALQSEALVFGGDSCGAHCGAGHLYLLVKENGRRKVGNYAMLWIS